MNSDQKSRIITRYGSCSATCTTWREHCEAVCALMLEHNVLVIHTNGLPVSVAGCYKVTTNTIEIATGLSAYEELTTLLHEAGHALGVKDRIYADCCKRREWQAYAYGWRVIKHLRIPISRDTWRAQCQEDWQNHVRERDRKRFVTHWYSGVRTSPRGAPTIKKCHASL